MARARRVDRVRGAYDARAEAYDRRWAHYLRESVARTVSHLGARAGEAVLDVACGTGALSRAIVARDPTVAVVGVDISEGMLARARAAVPSGTFVVADAGRLPFADAVFDRVVSSSALHYWEDPRAGLGEMARVVRPGGQLVVTDWCADYLTIGALDLWLRLVGSADGGALRGAALVALVEAAGFRRARIDRYRIDWFWGLMTVVAER